MRALPLCGTLILLSACFEDVGPSCPEGAKGCPCLDLQCEDGLECRDGRCVSLEAEASESAASDAGLGSETGPAESSSEEDGASSESSSDETESSTESDATSTTTEATSSVEETSTTESEGETSTTETGEASSDASTGSAGSCGDGVLAPDEECDSTAGCDEACELINYDCNPLNNAPCPEDFKCSVVEEESGEILATCLPFMEPPPGQLHEGNCYYGGRHDEWCDVGLACAVMTAAAVCGADETNCCVEFCDLNDATFTCAYSEDACIPFLPPSAPEGLEQLGFCGRP